MKKIIVFAFWVFTFQAIFLTNVQAQVANHTVVDKVIGVLGDEIVLLSELEKQVAYAAQQQKTALPPNAKCLMLDNILTEKLLIHQAKVDSIEVSEDEVNTQIDARIDRILGMMGNNVSQFIDYYGQTPAEMKDFMADDMKSQLLAERMRQKIIEGATIRPSEVIAFYNKIPKDSVPFFNSEVEYSELVYKPVVNQAAKDEAYVKLSKIRKDIVENKASFEEMAKLHSDDLGSGKQGGDLGWQKRGTFVTEFEAAAYNLSENEISPIIETEFGYHIIQLLGRRGNLIHVRHILIKPVFSESDYQNAIAKLDSIRADILAKKISFEEAVRKYSDKNQQSYSNGGRVMNQYTGNTLFEIADLDFNVYFALDSLQPGDISEPVEFLTEAGEKFYRLLKLNSRTAPHKATLKTDYSKIQQAALNTKKNEIITKWVMDKVGSVYVKIDPTYSDCPELKKWHFQGEN
ncbi:MAG TPA: peptidylprolyl isomerase [Saprospiraceae bacterium]|nr:peptidylprolyl isomerase [Saprospiraceae bacterium]